MANLFEYTDYRSYLRDYIETERRNSPFVSLRLVGQKVNIDPSQLLKIIQGHLHLSPAKIDDVVHYLKLSPKEGEYFRLLIGYNKSKNAEQARMYFDKIVALSGVQCTELEREQYLFFMEWYYAAVWCALNVFDCAENYAELGAFLTPQIEESEVKEAIRLLERQGLIAKDTNGFWKGTDENLSTGKSWRSQAVKHHQAGMIRLGGEALDRIPASNRDISTVTLNVNPSVLDEMRTLTEEYRRTMIKLSNQTEDTDQVVQLNIQLFPLSKRGGME